jgi:hypothetical protein
MALATTQKGSSTIAEYTTKMKSLADDIASARKKLDDEELIFYVLACLDFEYNGVVSSIAARVERSTLESCMHSSCPMKSDRICRTVDSNSSRHLSLRPTMPHEVEVVPSEDEVVVVLAHAMVATVEVVTSSTSHEISFLRVNYVDAPIILSSSVTKDLILPIWEMRRVQTQHHPMVWIQIGMSTLVQLTMSWENWTSWS